MKAVCRSLNLIFRIRTSRSHTKAGRPREFRGMELHEVCHARRRLAGELEVVLAHPIGAIMPTTALPETFVPCKSSIGRSNATGTKCCAAGAGLGASRGTCSTRSNSGNRSCDQSCTFPIGSYKLSQCCEPSSEERSAGNLHATFCGNRKRATASGDPVGGIARCPPIPIDSGAAAAAQSAMPSIATRRRTDRKPHFHRRRPSHRSQLQSRISTCLTDVTRILTMC